MDLKINIYKNKTFVAMRNVSFLIYFVDFFKNNTFISL